MNPIETIEGAAANCYDTKDYTKGKLINNCYESGHLSVLEHANFTFHIEGISRACSHQLVRTRTASISQRSQRYVSEDNFDYVTPYTIVSNPIALKLYEDLHEEIKNVYQKLQKLHIPNEDARFVLPNSCETILEFTIDLRNFIHLCNERLCTRSQFEIRELVMTMRDEVLKVYPELKDYLVPKCEKYKDYPFCTEHKSCKRHKKLSEVYKGK